MKYERWKTAFEKALFFKNTEEADALFNSIPWSYQYTAVHLSLIDGDTTFLSHVLQKCDDLSSLDFKKGVKKSAENGNSDALKYFLAHPNIYSKDTMNSYVYCVCLGALKSDTVDIVKEYMPSIKNLPSELLNNILPTACLYGALKSVVFLQTYLDINKCWKNCFEKSVMGNGFDVARHLLSDIPQGINIKRESGNVLFRLLQSEKQWANFDPVVCLLFDFVPLPLMLERFQHKLTNSQIGALKKSHVQYEKKSLLEAVEGSVVVSQRSARKI